MKYFLGVLLTIFVISCSSPTSVEYQQAMVEYTGSGIYDGTYEFIVIDSPDIIYSVIEIDTGDFKPKDGNRYCMKLEPIKLRDYKMISLCN